MHFVESDKNIFCEGKIVSDDFRFHVSDIKCHAHEVNGTLDKEQGKFWTR